MTNQPKTALITGITGQDGSYLAEFLYGDLTDSSNLVRIVQETQPDENDQFAGFFTIANHAVDMSALSALRLGSLPKNIPCARLIMLGVDKAYKGHDLGRRLMKQALAITKQS